MTESQRNVSRRFRRELRGQLAAWQSDGLISADQSRALEERYALARLAAEGHGLLLTTIYTIGSVLIGAGVISLVAAHWEAIPRAVRVVLIFAAMLGAHITGYSLWRVKGTRPKLGHALVTLGTLIFGANIGLMAQIFHISSGSYNAFAAWAVGALVISYCLWSVPNAVIAVVTSLIWYCAETVGHHVALTWYPVALLAAGLPVAYVKRSGFAFFMVLVGFVVSAHVAAWTPEEESLRSIAIMGIGVALLLGACGAFHVAVWPRPEVAPTALTLSGLTMAVWSYFLSFRSIAEELTRPEWLRRSHEHGLAATLIAAVFCAGVVLWAVSGRKALRNRSMGAYSITLWLAVVLSAVAAGLGRERTLIVVFSNAALFALGTGLIWAGVLSLQRTMFWFGVALVGALILSRFLEYETGLMLKAAAFLASGVGVIWGGVKFESALRRRGVAHE